MALIDNSTLTPSQKTKAQMDASLNQCFKMMVTAYNNNMNNVWRNRFGLTAQQVLDEYATDATALFQNAAAIKTLVNGVAPNTIGDDVDAAYWTPIFNQDGSVTLTALSGSGS